ncbi:thiamine phosphate synthase [Roseomonas sp. NAR14]|uniref:Thiamine-phosphate synthase n=1 Tax=Roseomonas acroporae TaxID=2937791 RepID=A0A9X2BU97_9PROT|nr:thiamine phosphate synthase [Roseomonas acroporae]MCK8785413.1 thiamine phosphate synthase [Roseomonas acroporae]
MAGRSGGARPEAGREEEGGCRLYLVTPPALDPAAFAPLLASALDAGDVAALQLRLKDAPDDAIRRAVDSLLPVAQSRGVAFLLNDRADLAAELGCDGAHLGQGDGDHAAARRLLGPERTLGITCHDSRHLAMEAGELGADYVAFGAFFPTATKEAAFRADPELLRWWSALFELPCVAIGGITAANCAPLVQAGADFLAVVGAVWNHPDGPAAGVRAMNAAIAAARPG